MSTATAAPTQRYLLGVYDDEVPLLAAVNNLQGRGIQIFDVYTPFPVHGLDIALGLKRSRLPKVAFVFGVLGAFLALLMQFYMNWWDWPMDIGGKPNATMPTFVPIAFEVTILLASLGMVAAYLVSNNLKPGLEAQLADIRQTDDRFVIAVAAGTGANQPELVRQALSDSAALDVRDSLTELRSIIV
jgi:Protein of unknown function (DUF3341)